MCNFALQYKCVSEEFLVVLYKLYNFFSRSYPFVKSYSVKLSTKVYV